MNAGIDYGRGLANIDNTNGIRYGVINPHTVGEAWYEDAEYYYGDEYSCPYCGSVAELIDDTNEDTTEDYDYNGTAYEVACHECNRVFSAGDGQTHEPISVFVDNNEIQAEQVIDGLGIFVTKSKYYTYTRFCSPCCPGAGDLDSPDTDDGVKAYCFGHEWFEGNKAPYPVYRVSDDSLVDA